MSDHRPQQSRRFNPRPSGGFTLTELMVVITIIGIIVSFILVAAAESVETAKVKATQGLIQKLDTAMSERMEALMTLRADYNAAHYYLATVWGNDGNGNIVPYSSADRAQVLAMYDFIKAEVPDVFVLQIDPTVVDASNQATLEIYPFNFAASPCHGTVAPVINGTLAQAFAGYFLPLGSGIASNYFLPPNYPDPAANRFYDANLANSFGAYQYNYSNLSDPGNTSFVTTGIFGASYTAAAGIYKNLGYYPTGYDGIDNNGNNLIDELAEGVDANNWDPAAPGNGVVSVKQRLLNHTHKTARSEMLYALLVEGQGPFGSAFAADDFTGSQVADTDNDGLPELVDAWGEPLQFYRWPIFYRSDVQKGFPDLDKIRQDVNEGFSPGPYGGVFEDREQNPLDANQQLVNPAWLLPLSSNNNFNNSPPTNFPFASTTHLSVGAVAFQSFFHTVVEPLAVSGGAPSPNTYWDRSGSSNASLLYFLRRSYLSKFVIVSSGRDKSSGIARLSLFPWNDVVDYTASASGLDDRAQFPLVNATYATTHDGSGAPVPNKRVKPNNANLKVYQPIIDLVIQIENQGAALDPNRQVEPGNSNQTVIYHGPQFSEISANTGADYYRNDTNTYLRNYAGLDDISNHTMQAPGGSSP